MGKKEFTGNMSYLTPLVILTRLRFRTNFKLQLSNIGMVTAMSLKSKICMLYKSPSKTKIKSNKTKKDNGESTMFDL